MSMDMIRIGDKLINQELIEHIDLGGNLGAERVVSIVMTNRAKHEYSGERAEKLRVWILENYNGLFLDLGDDEDEGR